MNISILGWFGSGNFGDELILLSQLQLLGKKNQYYIYSFNPQKTKKKLQAYSDSIKQIIHLGQKTHFFRTQFRQLFQGFNNSDLILIGGGGMLQDAYNFYTAPFLASFVFLAKLFGKRVGFFLVGAGPMYLSFTRHLIRLACQQADFVSVRDQHSAQQLQKLGIPKSKIFAAADPVLAYQSNHINASTKPQLLICLRQVSQWQALDPKQIAAQIDTICQHHHLIPIFLPLSRYTNQLASKISEPRDITVAKEVIKHLQTAARVKQVSNFNQAAKIISSSQLIISMRLHGLILAANQRTPFISLSYRQDNKLHIFADSINQAQHHLYLDQINQLPNLATSIISSRSKSVRKLNSPVIQKQQLIHQTISHILNTASNKPLNIWSLIQYFSLASLGSLILITKSIIYRHRTFYVPKL